MTFVVTDNCIKCKYTDCVEVCPVDCFYEGPNFLVIHPDECIDCALCEPECPAVAIFSEDEVPEDMQEFIQLNVELAEIWPNITEKNGIAAGRRRVGWRQGQDQGSRTLTFCVLPKKARCGPFCIFGSGPALFCRQKKRGGVTRPHFFPSPFFPFHHPDESHPAMFLSAILRDRRVYPSTQG